MTIKDFDAISGLDKPARAEFRMGGRVWHVRATTAVVPYIKAQFKNEEGEDRISIERLVSVALVPGEIEPFLKMLNDPKDSPLTDENLQPFADWLMEQMGKGRRDKSSSSESGSTSTGASSKDASSSPATRRTRSKTSRSTRPSTPRT